MRYGQQAGLSSISIDKAAWAEEFKLHEEHFSKLAHNLPKAMSDTLKALEARLETA